MILLTLFHATSLFLYLLKTSENLFFLGDIEGDQWHQIRKLWLACNFLRPWMFFLFCIVIKFLRKRCTWRFFGIFTSNWAWFLHCNYLKRQSNHHIAESNVSHKTDKKMKNFSSNEMFRKIFNLKLKRSWFMSDCEVIAIIKKTGFSSGFHLFMRLWDFLSKSSSPCSENVVFLKICENS